MAGGKWAQKLQMGKETTAGTAVAATTIWRGPASNLQTDNDVQMVEEEVGIAINTDRSYIPSLGASLSMAATPATFEQFPYLLEAGVEAINTGSTGGGSAWIRTYDVGLTALKTIQSFTLESGDNQQAEEAEYCFVTDLTLSGEKKSSIMMSANWIGRQTTNASFTGALAVPTVEEILGAGSLYIDGTGDTYGDSQVTQTLLGFSLNLTTGWRPKWFMDTGNLFFEYHYFDKDSFSAELELKYEHNTAVSTTEKAAFKAQTPRLFRLEFPGTALTTAGTDFSFKTLRIDAVGKYTGWSAVESEDGNSIINATVKIGYNETIAEALEFVIVNENQTLT